MDAEGIARLFTVPVAARVATAEDYDASLLPAEAAAVAGAVARRRREFAAGRACARAALGALGLPASPLTRGPDRAPSWPDGHVGSLTHCDGFCAAVAARADVAHGLGLDAEDAGPLPPDIARYVCRTEELARFERQAEPAGATWPKLAFSAKEAFYKCYHPITRTSLGFDEVSVWFASPPGATSGSFRIVIETRGKAGGALFAACDGRWLIAEGRVHAGVTLPVLAPILPIQGHQG